MIAQTLSITTAGLLIVLICLLLLGWGGLLSLLQRVGLATFAAGLLLAAIPRFQGRPPGWADVVMLAGLALYLGATYAPRIIQHIDGLDGASDGRLDLAKAMKVARRERAG